MGTGVGTAVKTAVGIAAGPAAAASRPQAGATDGADRGRQPATGSSAGSAPAGMSTVYQALDTVLERPVAVKLLAEHLAEDEAFVARFRREALAAAKLMHPSVVQVFDSGRDDATDRHYIVMEYVDGPSYADLLREYKQLEVEETVAIVRDACQALDYAHRAGVVHRDVKPGNLLHYSNETGTIKLADFGIAKAAERTRITQVSSVLGTAAYLSPEQARGDEGWAGVGHLLAGRVRLPVPHRPPSARVLVLAELALKQQEENVEPAATLPPRAAGGARRRDSRGAGPTPETRYERAQGWPALRAGFHGHATEATRALTDSSDRAATQIIQSPTDETQALRTREHSDAAAPRAPRRRDRPKQKKGRSGSSPSWGCSRSWR